MRRVARQLIAFGRLKRDEDYRREDPEQPVARQLIAFGRLKQTPHDLRRSTCRPGRKTTNRLRAIETPNAWRRLLRTASLSQDN